MTRRNIYDKILETVCCSCEVDLEDLLRGVKRSECVNARSIAAHYLLHYGVLARDVIRFSEGKVKHRYSFTKSATQYHDRYSQSFSFRCDADDVGNKLQAILQ